MLDELHVKNVALIREATFTPARGLTVVTGETGAGKTALLSAIKLLAGERADAACVREGAASAEVEGRFFIAGDDAEDGHVAARRVSADGRSRASFDGSLATVGQLAHGVGATIDLCGQHEHQLLLKPANHAAMLDAWAGDSLTRAAEAYVQAFDAERAAASELARIEEASQASTAELEQARYVLRRIDEVNPTADEYDDIMRELPRAENAEALARACEEAYQTLSGEAGAISQANVAAGALNALASADSSLADMASAIYEASYLLEDVARDVRSYRDGIDLDPRALEALQERASALQGLMREYGPRMQDVLARRDQAAQLVASVDDSEALLAAARTRHAAAEAALVQAADAFNAARASAAPLFAEAVNVQMARLEMGGAALVVSVEPLERARFSRAGASKVEFLYRVSASSTPRPLARIASGGEVSRVMLACKVVLGRVDECETLVFDEVDAGVAGSVAVALAGVLAELAETHQVIVVTHLAQVAVRGQRHFVVSKEAAAAGGAPGVPGADIPETTLCEVEGEARVAELARMLSGEVNEASLSHARDMLAEAESAGV